MKHVDTSMSTKDLKYLFVCYEHIKHCRRVFGLFSSALIDGELVLREWIDIQSTES